ncbi:ankyrin repeat domain-containing protein [Streptomyces sp. NPDC002187]|uniref:ankyrin repeat domain-containing protein n=1 Tax=Streptomyces sp. NPDC002187 TaxID=3364637 RepID=UPI00368F2BA8
MEDERANEPAGAPAGDPAAEAAQDLFTALYDGEDAVVRLLRAGARADGTDEEGRTPLYLAAVSGEAGVVRLLLAAGADPDRACGVDEGDLPLCGAAANGHTEAVRALLAAGARPDLREAFDFTALAWAAGQGHEHAAEALLEYGADPDLPGPGGEPPLVLAARRGSPSTVRALLGAGASAHAAALEEARQWLARDVEQELRDGLLGAYGSGQETLTRRVEEDGGVTVVVEVLRDGVPGAGNERQTGHGAIATVLEQELGMRTPYAELAGRALRDGRPDFDNWSEPATALSRRGDEETFRAAAAGCASDDPLHQAFAADVLAQLGFMYGAGPAAEGATAPADPADGPVTTPEGAPESPDGSRTGMAQPAAAAGTDVWWGGAEDVRRPFAARALPLLRELAREAQDAELIQSAVLGLGHQGDPAALPEILRHAGHPDPEVRYRVVLALAGLVPAGHADGIAALITLTRDADTRTRDWATMALAAVPADTPDIREALAARTDDADPDTAAEAARGLAMRQDPRADEVLTRLLAEEDPDGFAYGTAMEAVGHIQDERLRRRLEGTVPRRR